MAERDRYVVGLTPHEIGLVRRAVQDFVRRNNERDRNGAIRRLHYRLTKKLDEATRVNTKQASRLEKAAMNMLDDPEIVRDHHLSPAFKALEALRKAMV